MSKKKNDEKKNKKARGKKEAPGAILIVAIVLGVFGLTLVIPPLRDAGEVGWVGILGSMVLGLPLLWLSAAASLAQLRLLLAAQGETTLARQSWRMLTGKASLRSLLSAVPYTLLAATVGAYWARGYVPPWESSQTIEELMALEFITLHSMLFLGWLAMVPVESWPGRCLKWALFLALAWGYVAIAEHNLTTYGFYELVLVSTAKWAFLVLWPPKAARFRIMVSRWAVGTILIFLYGIALFDGQPGGPASIVPGMLYFTTLAILEALGILGADPDPEGYF